MRWRYNYTLLGLIVVGNFVQVGSRLTIGALVPDIMSSFVVSKSAIGLALSGMWTVYAMFQFPSGVFADNFGDRRVIVTSIILTGIGSLLLAVSPSYFLFTVFALFLGAGAGLFFPVGTSLLTSRFDNKGQAIGFLTAGGALSGLIAPSGASLIAIWMDWRVALLPTAGAAFVVVGLLLWKMDETADQATETNRWPAGSELVELLTRPHIMTSNLIACTAVFSFQSVTSFLPTFFVEYWSLSTATAGAIFGGIFLVSAAMQPIAGRFSDVIGRDYVLVLNTAFAGFGFWILLTASSIQLLYLGAVFLGLGLSWAGVIQVRFMDHLATHERRVGFGIVRTVYMFVGALGSVVTGVLAETFSWVVAYGLLACLLGIVSVSLLSRQVVKVGLS